MSKKMLYGLGLFLVINLIPHQLLAGDSRFLFQTSIWTHHYQHDPKHNNQQELINIIWYADSSYHPQFLADYQDSWVRDIHWFIGGSTFKNSYSQRTYYGYIGGRYNLPITHPHLQPYGQVTAGLIHGYKGKYQDKVAFNDYGTAPAFIPSIGLDYRRFNMELVAFSGSGVMLNAGFYF